MPAASEYIKGVFPFFQFIALRRLELSSKRNLLPQWSHRIIWGIPALHAFGHQYTCQVVYHPHKLEVFGRNEGEGTERVWSLMSPIIRPCRVSGVSAQSYLTPWKPPDQTLAVSSAAVHD